MEVWRYNGRQRDGRDEAFVGGGSGSKSNSILLVVRDSTPDCHAIACDRMQSHEIANLMSTTVRVLENASGTRSGTESLPKCFFTTTVNRFHLLFFSPFSKRKKWEAGLILHSKTCFFCSQLSWRNTSGRIFSPVSPKQVPNVFLPAPSVHWRTKRDHQKTYKRLLPGAWSLLHLFWHAKNRSRQRTWGHPGIQGSYLRDHFRSERYRLLILYSGSSRRNLYTGFYPTILKLLFAFSNDTSRSIVTGANLLRWNDKHPVF